ncbi:hypothetical protein FIBSPDRAFT_930091 [Athelia psychrophila]|uniref:Uncharacterized protein n=1 Tax=Athelia psychrophila TaxID=1759441 RepID=A0A166MLM9_9AGAM|nr:hypothetical protein FIBSPDRAFT_930091 [Fibularhizoctonia sp. CBS 109695]
MEQEITSLKGLASALAIGHGTFGQADCKSRATISSLPDELLSTIFEVGRASSTYKSHFEILVSHVTQRWRNIALHTPRIWSTIRRAAYQDDLEPFEVYLQRSGCVPIDLRVEISFWRSDENMSSFSTLFRNHTARWRRLSVSSETVHDVVALLDCIISLPNVLESIHIECEVCDGELGEAPPSGHMLAGALHCLTTLSTDLTIPYFLTPSKTITHLRIAFDIDYHHWRIPSTSITAALSAMSLEYLHVTISSYVDFESTAQSSQILQLPTLQSLFVESGNCENAYRFSSTVDAPLLHTLAFRTHYKHHGVPSMSGAGFGSLRNLKLVTIERNGGFQADWLSHFASNFPDITRLQVDDTYGLLRIMTGQSYATPNIANWPNLHTLSITSSAALEVDSIKEILSARWMMDLPVRKLMLHKRYVQDAVDHGLSEHAEVEEFLPEISPVQDWWKPQD